MKKHLKLISVLLVLVLFFLFAVGSSNSSEEPKETTTLENETYADEDFEPELEYKDDYLIATYDYLSTPLPSTESIDVYLKATILDSDNKWMIVQDPDENLWTITFTSQNDLREYNGTICEIYAGTVGGISKQYETPLLFLNEDNHHIVFKDSKMFYPENFDSCQEFKEWSFQEQNTPISSVWIPTDGGQKYHSKSTCSGMNNPKQISELEAISSGYSKCGRCW